MSEVTPHLAPIVVLLFLGSIFLVGLSLLIMLFGAVRRSKKLLRLGLATVAVVSACYFLLLVGVSAASSEKNLPPGGWKYFCEIDCHIGYSVAGVQASAALGPQMQPLLAHGKFVIVDLKVWFDQRTISPTRGDGPLTPNARRVVLLDDSGRNFELSPDAEPAFYRGHADQTSLRRPLRPGESFSTQLVFDVPKESRGWRLLITEDDPESHLLVGHENSPFHKKIYLDLASAPNIASAVSALTLGN